MATEARKGAIPSFRCTAADAVGAAETQRCF